MALRKGFCDLGFAKVDTGRLARRGFPEVVYSPGKNLSHLKAISRALIRNRQDLILTKLEKKVFLALKRQVKELKYNSQAKLGFYTGSKKVVRIGNVLVISAGTSDIPVAEEASVTLEIMGNEVKRLYDVGVAGVHRLMHNIQLIKEAKVIIVVAGMEGALASLVSGLSRAPVVAVPTSCGYGANFAGLSALLTMLNSCSCGVTVVNIDNGFGAGYFASMINQQ